MPNNLPIIDLIKIIDARSVKGINIRGQKFCKGASLEEFDFRNSTAGVKQAWLFLVSLNSFLLAVISGIILSAGCYFSLFLLQEPASLYYGFFLLFLLGLLIFSTFKSGFTIGTVVSISGLIPFGILDALRNGDDSAGFVVSFFIGSSAIFLTSFGIAISALSAALKPIRFTSFSANIILLVIVCELIFATQYSSYKFESSLLIYIGFIYVLITSALGGLIAMHSMQEKFDFCIEIKPEFLWIERTVVFINAIQGTSFYKLNLDRANFENSLLEYTDFRGASLTHTRFFQAKGLNHARLNGTYLENPDVRQLVISCDGQGKFFDGLNLTGVNLQGAKLQDASFAHASLNQSNLRGANLSRAILKQTQLEGADLAGAILTGAYIEDWGITSTTKLDDVRCDYIYMRVPTKENPNPLRKPDNWQENFAQGEFANFIQPYFDTLDLYHSQNVDPRAISIAFKKLSQNYPEANLEIVAMEKRGQSSLNLKVRTASTANKSELSSEYFDDYNKLKLLSESRLLLLAEKDDRIHSLEQMIQTALHQPTFTVETVQGDFMPENKSIDISAGHNANISGVSSGDGIVNLGTISGDVTNAINQLPDSSEAGQESLKALLTKLQKVIETDVDLSDLDKSDLLEQVQLLAEAKQIDEPAKRESIARKAVKMFDATLKSLPDTAKIVEACSKLLPLILRVLGIPV